MSNKLVLNEGAPGTNGCDPNVKHWKPKKKADVKIENKSGSEQKLWCITKGLLSPVKDNSITIPDKGSWKGTVGSEKGTYLYSYDGSLGECDSSEEDALGPRKGTIDPS